MTTASGEAFTVSSREAARLIVRDVPERGWAALMTGDVSATEFGRAVGWPLRRAHHVLSRLLAAGLVQVVRVDARAGRPVRPYRAVSRDFRVPFTVTDAATLSEYTRTLVEPFMRAFSDAVAQELLDGSEDTVTQLRLRKDGRVELNFGLGTGAPAPQLEVLLGRTRTVRLTPASARALRETLDAAFASAQDEEGGDPVTAAVFLMPGDANQAG